VKRRAHTTWHSSGIEKVPLHLLLSTFLPPTFLPPISHLSPPASCPSPPTSRLLAPTTYLLLPTTHHPPPIGLLPYMAALAPFHDFVRCYLCILTTYFLPTCYLLSPTFYFLRLRPRGTANSDDTSFGLRYANAAPEAP